MLASTSDSAAASSSSWTGLVRATAPSTNPAFHGLREAADRRASDAEGAGGMAAKSVRTSSRTVASRGGAHGVAAVYMRAESATRWAGTKAFSTTTSLLRCHAGPARPTSPARSGSRCAAAPRGGCRSERVTVPVRHHPPEDHPVGVIRARGAGPAAVEQIAAVHRHCPAERRVRRCGPGVGVGAVDLLLHQRVHDRDLHGARRRRRPPSPPTGARDPRPSPSRGSRSVRLELTESSAWRSRMPPESRRMSTVGAERRATVARGHLGPQRARVTEDACRLVHAVTPSSSGRARPWPG